MQVEYAVGVILALFGMVYFGAEALLRRHQRDAKKRRATKDHVRTVRRAQAEDDAARAAGKGRADQTPDERSRNIADLVNGRRK